MSWRVSVGEGAPPNENRVKVQTHQAAIYATRLLFLSNAAALSTIYGGRVSPRTRSAHTGADNHCLKST